MMECEWLLDWYAPAFAVPSPNHGLRPTGAQVDLLVLHSISLPPGRYGGAQVHALFTNVLDWNADPYFRSLRGLRVSAHFFLQRNGTLWQFVGCDRRAWHAGASAYRGRDQCNDDSIGIELEGLEGDAFTAVQYGRLVELVTALRQRYPIAHIAGHEHVAPGRKGDPGAGFDWERLQHASGLDATHFPPQIR